MSYGHAPLMTFDFCKVLLRLLWDDWEAKNEEIEEVAAKFIFANCYNQKVAGDILQKQKTSVDYNSYPRCQVSESQNPQGFVENCSFKNLNKIL